MRVRDLIDTRRQLHTTDPGAALSDAVSALLAHDIGALPVVARDGRPVGILAERDVVRALHADAAAGARPVSTAMRRPAPTCLLDDTLLDVAGRMTRERLRHLVVCDGGRPVAMLSVGDVVKHRLEQLEVEAGVLRDYVVAQRARI